ncbi:hypothetical protein IT397_03195 [Candidatus Nomurabacteria bacterium]|nr:hypothetical protein [Candidatus Nomurabacteria bacterium]
MTQTTTTGLTNVSARITAEVLLGKIRFPNHGSEPTYLFRIREIFKRFEKAVGRESLESALPEIRQMMHVFADLLFDTVTGIKSPKTIEGLQKLPVPFRVSIEQVVNAGTGRTSPDKRWDNTLYHFRKVLDQVVALSISGITMEEIRSGYDEMIHSIVDHICDNWKTIID